MTQYLLAAIVALTMLVVPAQSQIPSTTVPAFLWSPHLDDLSENVVREAVNYQILSPKDLAKSVLIEGGLSNFLCSEKKLQQHLDLALVFVGKELQSSDISGNKPTDPPLVDLLKVSFMRSNYSMAFPYVAASDRETMEDALLSGFTEGCQNDMGIIGFQKLANLNSVRDYLVSRMDKTVNGRVDLLVFSNEVSQSSESHSESHIFSELISSLEQSGAKYAALYVSVAPKSIQYPSHRELERFLAEASSGNGSLRSATCDEVCQIKSSLLEGLLVGIVLLIILISGLCCMMGIDTPTRYETPQES